MKLSIAPLSNRAVSTVDRSAHTVKGTFIFCMLWYTRSNLFALPQVVEVEQFKNPLARQTLHSGLYPERRRSAPSTLPPVGRLFLRPFLPGRWSLLRRWCF